MDFLQPLLDFLVNYFLPVTATVTTVGAVLFKFKQGKGDNGEAINIYVLCGDGETPAPCAIIYNGTGKSVQANIQGVVINAPKHFSKNGTQLRVFFREKFYEGTVDDGILIVAANTLRYSKQMATS